MTGQTQAVKVELKGKTRKLVEMYAQACVGGSEAALEALEPEKTNVVITSEEQIDGLQDTLKDITEDPDYNGHMDRYRKSVRSELEAARAHFW